MRIVLLVCLVFTGIGCPWAQNSTDNISMQFNGSSIERVRLHNKYGTVKIKGVSGNTISMKAKRTIKANSNAEVNKLKDKIFLDTMTFEGQLVFYVQSPYQDIRIEEDGISYNSWSHDSWDDHKKRAKYSFDIELSIPMNKDLYVTNHEKDLVIDNINGQVKAKNHHDDITMTNIGGSASARTHHGDIEISYKNNPTVEGSYKTHHGDIKVKYTPQLSADFSLYSYHGDFFTAFDWKPSVLPVSKNSEKGTVFKVEKGTTVQIGKGGVDQHFKTHHGDIYIEKT